MASLIVLAALLTGTCNAVLWGHAEKSNDRCEAVIEETVLDDRATSADDTPSRLHSTWLSQECEARTGPEYVIRKYTFYENGTFLLLRHHYAEESCSVATHTVTARGAIKLMSPSILTPGATEARFYLDTVHIVPLNRQVAHKFGHRLNVSCEPQPKWRPYVAQPIYEQPSNHFATPRWYGPRYNTHQVHSPLTRKQRNIDCLESLGIEFGELRLLRVQKKPAVPRSLGSISSQRPRVELLLGSLPPNAHSKWSHRPTSLQSSALLRADTISGCPICGSVSRATEYSPPLLHEVAALPALLGGSWLSMSCESVEGGLWSRRQLQIFSGDKLWAGRWDYYDDPRCAAYLYTVTAAGSYVQRAGRQRRHGESGLDFDNASGERFDFDTVADEGLEADDDYARRARQTEREASLDARALKLDVGDDERSAPRFFGRIYKALKGADFVEAREWNTGRVGGGEDATSDDYLHRERNAGYPERDVGTTEASESRKVSSLEGDEEEVSVPLSVKGEKDETSERSEKNEKSEKSEKSESNEKSGRKRATRSLDEGTYRHLLQKTQPAMAASYAAMLRGNQRQEETTKKPSIAATTPFGTTELDLHVAESLLIPGNFAVASRCRGRKNEALDAWPRNCVPRFVEAPSTLGLRARIGVSWSGLYTLSLGPRDDDRWDPALRQCGQTSPHNAALRAHLRRSLGISYGLYSGARGIWSQGYATILLQHTVAILLGRALR